MLCTCFEEHFGRFVFCRNRISAAANSPVSPPLKPQIIHNFSLTLYHFPRARCFAVLYPSSPASLVTTTKNTLRGVMISAAIAAVAAASLVKSARAVECSQTCYYEVKANMMWSPERFPTDFPPALEDPMAMMNAHFSPLWTVAHDSSFVLWRNGELSNPGIQQIAETGAGDNFMEEVEACGASCGPGEGFPCMPFSGVCESSGEVRLVAAYPYLSAANMVAPSPDWFAGVDSVPLCVDGEWVESVNRDLFPYDAGTDSGESFLSPDAPTTPFEPIFRFTEVMPESENIFYNPAEGATLPIGSISITRVRCDGDDMAPATPAATPPAMNATTPPAMPATMPPPPPPAATPATPPTPAATPATPAAGAGCGMNGQPVCSGAALEGRKYECDFGYVGENGMCVPWTPRADRERVTGLPPCGMEGQPVCSGDALNGRKYECDFGYIGENGICIPYEEHKNGKAGKMSRKSLL